MLTPEFVYFPECLICGLKKNVQFGGYFHVFAKVCITKLIGNAYIINFLNVVNLYVYQQNPKNVYSDLEE